MIPSRLQSNCEREITVWLDERKENEKILKQFRCCVCGKVVFEYYGKLKMILPGGHSVSEPKVIQCKGRISGNNQFGQWENTSCNTKYYIV
jgi:hypothetical protein